MRVALVYDRVNKWGGAERILLALHELFPDAPLYTSVYDKEHAKWANVFDVRTSFLQKIPFAKSAHEYFALCMPLAFESFSFDEYDLVISITSEAGKGIITKPGTRHICYCLTPTRYLWSGFHEYFANRVFRFITSPVVSYLRAFDKVASNRPDAFIAISKEVQKRISMYYGKKSKIVYPPLAIYEGKNMTKKQVKPYFLVVSRLVTYKRVDLAIKACNELNLPLKIIGTGMEFRKLKLIAGANVEFLGSLTDEEVVEYYKGCQALLFPGIEDFGLTIVEAQQYGKPVIAYRGGGALETIVEGKTGLFFYPQTIKSLVYTLKRFKRRKFDPKVCVVQAEHFSKAHFQEAFLKEVL